jgi:hypothetical protein
MPIRDQDHGGIAMASASLLGRGHELVYLGAGQVFAGALA